MCANYSYNFADPNVFEGTAPRNSGLLCVKGVFYRVHEIHCPLCDHISIRIPLTDSRAAFGVKVRCGVCRHERIYHWAGRREKC